MVHLRIAVPSDRSEKVLGLLEAAPSTCNLVYLAGADRQPKGDVVQLAVNLTAIVLAGVTTLYIQRRLYERRRLRHLGDGARAATGLPADPRGEPSRR